MTLVELLRHLAELRVGFGLEDGGLHIVTDFDLSPGFAREIQRAGRAIVALLEGLESGPWATAGELLELVAPAACYSSDQAADRALHAVTRKRTTSTRIGSRRKRSGLGRAPGFGDRTRSPRGRGRS